MTKATAEESSSVAAVPAANRPIVKKQLGNISVAVFVRDVSAADGTIFKAKNYVLQKSWKDKHGVWQDQSINLKPREILAVQKALDEAFVASYDSTNDDEE